MNKTLLVKIDNTQLPKGIESKCIVLDCRPINEFCSLLGDAIVGDLVNSDGMPLWRIIQPIGSILIDYQTFDSVSFDSIISKCFDMFEELILQGLYDINESPNSKEKISMKLPDSYIDWLIRHENSYYTKAGKLLKTQKGELMLDLYGMIKDILSSISYKITSFIKNNGMVDYLIFNCPRLSNSSSFAQKFINIGIEILRFDTFCEIINQKSQETAKKTEKGRMKPQERSAKRSYSKSNESQERTDQSESYSSSNFDYDIPFYVDEPYTG